VKLRFTPPAVLDLTAIADHIRERNPAAAARVRSSILSVRHPARKRKYKNA
jgi:plasmid stabilization system protein ParE